MKKSQGRDKVVVLKSKKPEVTGQLLSDIRLMIEQSRHRVSQVINAEIVLLYWNIGKRIREDILRERRAAYGEEIVSALAVQLTNEYGKGFTRSNLFYMIRFAEVYSDREIVHALSGHLSWTHLRDIIYLEDQLKRGFYAEMCRIERWSTRTLKEKINSMLYERTAISKKPAELARQELKALKEEDRMTPDLVFRDPYLLEFLGLADTYSERDLEEAILRELERFLLEVGTDFAFLARQKRITVDHEDYYLDLLFFHRRLRCLVAIDLKLRKFQAADKGQMELYLRWLEKYEQQRGEDSPIGLILCADKSEEQIKLLQLDKSGIRVAAYLTELPPRKVLQEKLHEAILLARARLEEKSGEPGNA